MKKFLFMLIVVAHSVVRTEDILAKPKKTKTESVSKLKEQIGNDLEELLRISTRSIKHLANLVDTIATDIKQLAGQEAGFLASADKKTLEQFRQNVCQIKTTLQELEFECCLKV